MTKSEFHEMILNRPINPEKVMQEYWGERCPDFEPECPACKAWKHFDRTNEVME